MDRHGSFFEAHNQWYFATNDRSHSTDINHTNSFRDTVIAYLHYYPNGSMAPVAINGTGVGSYPYGHVIEAENYFRLVEGTKHAALHASNGFAVTLQGRSGRVTYPNVQLSTALPPSSVRVALRQGSTPVERLVLQAEQGIIATCVALENVSTTEFQQMDCHLNVSLKEVVSLELAVMAQGESGCSVELDWLQLV
jgi:hypothetical protein